MNATAEQLLQSALTLPVAERLALAEAILEASTPESDHAVDAAWIAEAQKRSAQVDSGQEQLSSWSEVRARVREQSGRG